MDFGQLPNLIIIGAAKAGTTTLFDLLGQHPQVYAPKVKEIKFFSRDDRYEKGVDWYQETFFRNSRKYPVRIEASPAYLTWSDKTAPRIKDIYKDRPIKLVAIFRDPVKRAYSHYWDRVRQGDENLPFPDAIYAEENRLRENWEVISKEGNGIFGYFRAGCYATRIKPFLPLFPREDLFFLLQEDLINNFENSMESLFSFLQIDRNFKPASVRRNQASQPRSQGLLKLFYKIKKTNIQKPLRVLFPRTTRKSIRENILYKPVRYPPMDDEIKKYLYSRYLEEVKEFESIIQRDLSHWYSG
jgi:hypothetical protein